MNSVKRLFPALLVIVLCSLTALAQDVFTPEKGSPERRAIMDALRVPVERELKQRVVFAADTFNVEGDWAFLSGRPQTPDGGQPDYGITKYREAIKYGAFDNNFSALLRRSGDTWHVTAYRIGCTDVCYLDWSRRYRAPKAIFPYTE